MSQKLSQKKISGFKNSRKDHQEKNTWDNPFINVECPYCDSHNGFIFWSQEDTVGHCPECAKNWIESGGNVWKL